MAVLVGLAFILGSAAPSHAQALGWEGETGVFVTPLAYTVSAENQKVHAVTAYHFFNAGPVIGDFHEASIELGIGKRFEFGFTHEFHTFGNDAALSPLWQNGFEIFNGKFQVVPENYAKTKWVPAISAGFLARANVRNVGDFEAVQIQGGGTGMKAMSSGKTNGDVYVVASKVVPVKPVALVFSGGVRGTNAELWGMGGNAPNWQARAFGAVAIAFTGPGKSSIIFGSEAAQQPHHPYGFDTNSALPLNIPTTLTYCVRVVPSPKHKLNFDFGIAQVAGRIYNYGSTLIDLKARHQAGVQISYGF